MALLDKCQASLRISKATRIAAMGSSMDNPVNPRPKPYRHPSSDAAHPLQEPWCLPPWQSCRASVKPGNSPGRGPASLRRPASPSGVSGSARFDSRHRLSMSGVGSLVFLVPIFLIIRIRIRSGEGMLVAEFGDSYRAYRKRMKMLVPFLY